MVLELRRLEGRDLVELTVLFNYGFQEYLIPMKLSVEHTAKMIERENIDMSLSLEGLLNGQAVGFCWTGIRGDKAWCGGIAIGPEYRGKGYGRELMQECIKLLRDNGFSEYYLECIKENDRALALYRRLGFSVVGELYHLRNMNPAPIKTSDTRFVRLPGTQLDVFRYWDSLHRVKKSWQGDLPSIMYVPVGYDFEVYTHDDTVVGMLIYAENSQNIVIRDLAVADEDEELCRAILLSVHRRKKPIYYQFVPENSVAAKVMFKEGYESYIDQVQMVLRL